ncbi:transposase, partial [Mycobacterium sp. KBS0706]
MSTGLARRRWSRDEKRLILEEARAAGASVSEVARRHGVNANLLFKWLRMAARR